MNFLDRRRDLLLGDGSWDGVVYDYRKIRKGLIRGEIIDVTNAAYTFDPIFTFTPDASQYASSVEIGTTDPELKTHSNHFSFKKLEALGYRGLEVVGMSLNKDRPMMIDISVYGEGDDLVFDTGEIQTLYSPFPSIGGDTDLAYSIFLRPTGRFSGGGGSGIIYNLRFLK